MSPAPRSARQLLVLLSNAVVGQVLLSLASLFTALLLVRYASDHDYGSYVLVTSAILLARTLQIAFVAPPLVGRLSRLEREGRLELLAGAWRDLHTLILHGVAAILLTVLALAAFGAITPATALLCVAGVVATATTLRREFFRLALQAHRRVIELLKSDALYGALLVLGVLIAVHHPLAACTAVGVVAFAAWLSGWQASRALERGEGVATTARSRVLRELAPIGLWSAAGGGIHWAFGQGYNFLIAGVLDIGAVAAVAATRLTLMPVNLLSTGVGSLMLPITNGWLQHESVRRVLLRLAAIAGLVTALALVYFAVLWLGRDWVFGTVMRKTIEQRDTLLLLWGTTLLVMSVRDQLVFLPVARERQRELTALALLAAGVASVVILWAMPHYGAPGAVAGVLAGEIVNLLGIAGLCCHEAISPRRQPQHSDGSVSRAAV